MLKDAFRLCFWGTLFGIAYAAGELEGEKKMLCLLRHGCKEDCK